MMDSGWWGVSTRAWCARLNRCRTNNNASQKGGRKYWRHHHLQPKINSHIKYKLDSKNWGCGYCKKIMKRPRWVNTPTNVRGGNILCVGAVKRNVELSGAGNREKLVKPNTIVMRYLKHNPVENSSVCGNATSRFSSCIIFKFCLK